MNSSVRRILVLGLAVALLAPGCGRRGAPRPPEDVLPQTIDNTAARNEKRGIMVSWGRPDKYVNGSRMTDLAGFELWRSEGPSDDEEDFVRIAQMEVSDRDRFRQIERFRHLDVAVEGGMRYRYRVVSFTLDGYVSAPSNVATLERLAPQ